MPSSKQTGMLRKVTGMLRNSTKRWTITSVNAVAKFLSSFTSPFDCWKNHHSVERWKATEERKKLENPFHKCIHSIDAPPLHHTPRPCIWQNLHSFICWKQTFVCKGSWDSVKCITFLAPCPASSPIRDVVYLYSYSISTSFSPRPRETCPGKSPKVFAHPNLPTTLLTPHLGCTVSGDCWKAVYALRCCGISECHWCEEWKFTSKNGETFAGISGEEPERTSTRRHHSGNEQSGMGGGCLVACAKSTKVSTVDSTSTYWQRHQQFVCVECVCVLTAWLLVKNVSSSVGVQTVIHATRDRPRVDQWIRAYRNDGRNFRNQSFS